MISNFFVVVDAGGSPYRGTFSRTRDGSIGLHVFSCEDFMETSSMPIEQYEATWNRMMDRGDRCVECIVETSEQVSVTIKPILPPE